MLQAAASHPAMSAPILPNMPDHNMQTPTMPSRHLRPCRCTQALDVSAHPLFDALPGAGSSRKGASDTAVHLRSAASSTQFVASIEDRNTLLTAAAKCLNKQLQDVLPSGEDVPVSWSGPAIAAHAPSPDARQACPHCLEAPAAKREPNCMQQACMRKGHANKALKCLEKMAVLLAQSL